MKNIIEMKSYELRDYIDDLKRKEREEGLSLNEMELIERAMEERDLRKKSKAYHPEKDRHDDDLKELKKERRLFNKKEE